mmetsp:Transcript_38134/g.99830  ORF Transcript_38134/g.99830 Transcript_38134/m.99830 type:complete len:206 (-) Transcript_38134:203-820(-)
MRLLLGVSGAVALTCPPPGFDTDETNFNVSAYAAAPWYMQEQMAVGYLPVEQNYCVNAEYSRTKKTLWGYDVSVHNHAEEKDGKVHDGSICARIVDESKGKLEVAPCFLPALFAGPYWVIKFDQEVGYALVSGGPPTHEGTGGCRTGTGVNNAGLWILTRQREASEDVIAKARAYAVKKGFDVGVLNRVDQTNCSHAVVVDEVVV